MRIGMEITSDTLVESGETVEQVCMMIQND